MTAQPCARLLSMWEGEYEGECELPEGHDGPHCDGMAEWDAPDCSTDYDTIRWVD